MATEKTISARMQMKTDTALNWSKAINFIPKKGEIIIYEADSDYGYERMKIGDGSTKVNDLPFVIGAKDWNQNDSTASDYIKNRPGGYIVPDGLVLNYDGIIDGRETLDYDGLTFYKISSEKVFIEQLKDATLEYGDVTTTLYTSPDGMAVSNHKEHAFLLTDSGIYLAFINGAVSTTPLTLTQTYHGYAQIPSSMMADGIPISKLDRGSYIVIKDITSTEIDDEGISAKLSTGDYRGISLKRPSNIYLRPVDTDRYSYIKRKRLNNGTSYAYVIYGKNEIVWWLVGDDNVNYDAKNSSRFYMYNNYYIASPNKMFRITVDDTGAISATEVTT